MSLDKENFNSTDVYSPILGSAIEVPRMFWKPGTAASYNQHVGKTSVTGLWQGVLMAHRPTGRRTSGNRSIGRSPKYPISDFNVSTLGKSQQTSCQ